MTHLDNLVADSLAQSPDTVVHQLASEIERLRSAIADALRPLYEGGHIWVKPLEDAIRKPPENLFHKNCRSCICWNGDMCELISHVCENGEHWRPSTKFVMVHPEVAALADFAEEMRASASRFSVALDAVRGELEAMRSELESTRKGWKELAEAPHKHQGMMVSLRGFVLRVSEYLDRKDQGGDAFVLREIQRNLCEVWNRRGDPRIVAEFGALYCLDKDGPIEETDDDDDEEGGEV